MKKTNKIFNVFLLTTLAFVVLGVVFSTLALFLTYTEFKGNIKVNSVYSILFIVFTSLAFLLPIAQAIVIKDYKVTRAKNDMLFIKIASLISIVSLTVLALYDLIMIANGVASTPVRFETWKFFRMAIVLPVAASLFFNLLPTKIKVYPFIRYACALAPIAYCLFSDLSIYFNPGPGTVPEFFRITFSIAYIFGALFFLYDFKWNDLESSTRVYVALTTIFTSLGFITSISSIIFMLFANLTKGHTMVNVFEAFTLLLLSIYALSKLMALWRAVSITAKSEIQKSDTPPSKK